MVHLSVADEGEGIAPEHIARVTERFYRIDTSRSRSLGGTGLGLSIVKHIVERHRGRLNIDSEVGKGTTIHVLLPVPRGFIKVSCGATKRSARDKAQIIARRGRSRACRPADRGTLPAKAMTSSALRTATKRCSR